MFVSATPTSVSGMNAANQFEASHRATSILDCCGSLEEAQIQKTEGRDVGIGRYDQAPRTFGRNRLLIGYLPSN